MVRKQTQPTAFLAEYHVLHLDARTGRHFDFGRMPAHSGVTTSDLLTTQSEQDPD
jgi:hypothetical protein